MNNLPADRLRDVIIRAHGMATGRYVQEDSEMRRRIGALLEKAIQLDDVMRGFLGRGGPCSNRNALGGSGSLSEWQDIANMKPESGQTCIVTSSDGVAQWMALTWNGDAFEWADGYEYGESRFDPFPSEQAKYWMPFPKFEVSTARQEGR